MGEALAFRRQSVFFLGAHLAKSAVVTVGQNWVQPDLSRVDEVGFADLMRGSGHGWGGFVNVGKIEVYGRPVKR